MSRAIRTCCGQLHRPRHRVGDPVVGLVGDEAVELVDADAGRGRGPAGRPWPSRTTPSGRPRCPASSGAASTGSSEAITSRQSSRCRIRSYCSPSEPQTTGPMPGVVGRADDDGARAVGEDERRAAVGRAGDVGEPLDADHEDVARRCRRAPCRRRARCRGRSRRTRRRCRTRRPVGAELVRDRGGRRRRLEQVADGGDDRRSRSAAASIAGLRERVAGRGHRHRDDGLVGSSAKRRVLMPERCWIHSSLESIASTISALGTTRAGGRRRPRGCRRAARPVWSLRAGPSCGTLRGGGGAGAGRGDTGSPSSTSHSTTCAAVGGGDRDPVAQAGDVADRSPGASRSASAAARRGGTCPWRGRRPSATSAWCRSGSASPCLSQNARASSSWSGVLSANVSTPCRGRGSSAWRSR